MAFKIRLLIDENAEEEIIIRCKAATEEVLHLQALLAASTRELELTSGDETHFIETKSILFFETDGNKTAAHTKKQNVLHRQKALRARGNTAAKLYADI